MEHDTIILHNSQEERGKDHLDAVKLWELGNCVKM